MISLYENFAREAATVSRYELDMLSDILPAPAEDDEVLSDAVVDDQHRRHLVVGYRYDTECYRLADQHACMADSAQKKQIEAKMASLRRKMHCIFNDVIASIMEQQGIEEPDKTILIRKGWVVCLVRNPQRTQTVQRERPADHQPNGRAHLH